MNSFSLAASKKQINSDNNNDVEELDLEEVISIEVEIEGEDENIASPGNSNLRDKIKQDVKSPRSNSPSKYALT